MIGPNVDMRFRLNLVGDGRETLVEFWQSATEPECLRAVALRGYKYRSKRFLSQLLKPANDVNRVDPLIESDESQ